MIPSTWDHFCKLLIPGVGSVSTRRLAGSAGALGIAVVVGCRRAGELWTIEGTIRSICATAGCGVRTTSIVPWERRINLEAAVGATWGPADTLDVVALVAKGLIAA